jgi:hypothetical protein
VRREIIDMDEIHDLAIVLAQPGRFFGGQQADAFGLGDLAGQIE